MGRFRRVAIVNRGEAAMRLVNAAREFVHPDGSDVSLTTIALHTRAERGAMFVREADEAVCFDDLDQLDGPTAASPYLDLPTLEAALVAARAEAAWVGWGFVAERAEFADLCDRLGVVFIGPSGDVMRKLGDKVAAKHLATDAEVPLAPWSGGAVDSLEAAQAAAADVGFPLMVKASAGGGGRGIRRVDRPEDLADAFQRATAEAASSFGDPTVFLERVVTDARHVEVQIIADQHGNVWAPGVRDCSIQRRNQKVIEESASTALTPAAEAELRSAAARLASVARYQNAGTVEFLYQPEEDLLAFLEVNTRLQVEHPVTEVTTGLDLVGLQLAVAMGEPLPGECPDPRGHAFEARLNAEDPDAGFAPAPGRVTSLLLPTGPGVRVDTGIGAGDLVDPDYDSMVAKIIAWGPTRDAARIRLRRALQQTTVMVDGGTTNKSFLLDLVDRDAVVAGEADTSWLDRLTGAEEHHTDRLADVALVAAAIDVADEMQAVEMQRFLSAASRGRPEADPTVGHDVELRWRGADHRLHVAAGDLGGWYRVSLETRARAARCDEGATRAGSGGDLPSSPSSGRSRLAVDVVHERLDEHRSRLTVGARTHRIVSQTSATDQRVEVDGVSHRFSRDDAGMVRAPSVALVVSVEVSSGDQVRAGQRLAVVEAMKMETVVTAAVDGVVDEVYVSPNTQVDAGAPMLRIGRDDGNGSDAVAAIGLDLRALVAVAARDDTTTRLDVLRSILLGFDVADTDAVTALAAHAGEQTMDDADVRAAELDLLRAFADLCGLTRDRRLSGRDHGLETRSPREHFGAYLRSFDADAESLPDRFRTRLSDALGHYGVSDLDRSARLEAAAYRIHRAAQRRSDQIPLVMALLQRRLEHCGPTDEQDAVRDTLGRLVAATQAQYPSVGNLARSVRHRCIDRPLLDAARAHVSQRVDQLLHSLVDDARAETVIDELVATPMPLMRGIGGLDVMGRDASVRTTVAEVLTRRYYKIRDLETLDRSESPVPMVTTRYRHRGRSVGVVAVAGDMAELDTLGEIVARALEASEADERVVDLYLRVEPTATVDDVAATVGRALEGPDFAPARRVAVVAATAGPGCNTDGTIRTDADVHVLTWNRVDATLEEKVAFRGLHPMIDRRLNLWRLENFEVERLPSADDTHVFDCVAVDQPADERLIAVAEVRDITPLRDAEGTLIALPELERVLASCLDGIRQAQAGDARRQALEWNRVMLFVWPPVEITFDEINTVAKRLVPMTNGLGIEQVMVQGRIVDSQTGDADDVVVRLAYQAGAGLTFQITDPPTEPMAPLDDYTRKVLQCRRRGTVYPYELVPLLAGHEELTAGEFVELELSTDSDGDILIPAEREPGHNTAGIVVGLVTTPTAKYPDGMTRVAVLGDPTKSMGSIAEAECRRLVAAIDLAAEMGVPIEWFALSAGARIAMDSGSENLDWVAAVLRRLIEHTQAGGEVNVIVAGVNVGAQPYWNAEATMLMHTSGILVMTPDSTMVLTGKQAIDFSGGVSADDNIGIGGYERIMGPNGQAQYWASDIPAAVDVLFRHYDHSYVRPGEDSPRRAATTDPHDRDVTTAPHAGNGTTFTSVGEIFDVATNPDRKKPFDIRSVMRAVIDADHAPLERWTEMAEAEGAVVFDAHLGGLPVSVVGVESRPLPRTGLIPADGSAQWSAGTLFPLSSKKVARAINAASGNRPVVVLANLSGFDGSPESLRRLQLEYGAEIGRAIVNFDGRIVLCVLSRYHGGAFVVFSGRLNDNMTVLAVEGAHASVIGGAPAAAVVFTREVNARTQADPRIQDLEASIATARPGERARLRSEMAATRTTVRNEMLGVVAAEFDAVHSVERAKAVGSVHEIVPAVRLRPSLIAALDACS